MPVPQRTPWDVVPPTKDSALRRGWPLKKRRPEPVEGMNKCGFAERVRPERANQEQRATSPSYYRK